MAWTEIRISENELGRDDPAVSIGHKRISFNVATCKLIDQEHESYKYVQFYRDSKNPKLIGVRFWKYYANDNCVELKRKEIDGKTVGGLDVVNAYLMKTVFGDIAMAEKTTKYRVKKDSSDPYILVIDMN